MNDFKLEPEDFYLDDDGNMVFTAIYLKKRKFCCKSGCRHCPYGFGQSIDPDLPPELIQKSYPEEDMYDADDLLEKYADYNKES